MPDLLRRALTLAICLLPATLAAQAPTRPMGPPPGATAQAAGPDSLTLQSQAIRVFIDCQGRARGCGPGQHCAT